MTTPNWKNHTIWTGDNLPIMRGLNSECVDLIYLDPPFNSNQDYAAPIGSKAAGAAFKDTWTLDDVDRIWLLLLRDKDPVLYHVVEGARRVHGNSMASYLSMMAQRLEEMKRCLKPTGSIYLHCDPTASHYLKLLMDSVLGQSNFMNEVIWKRTSSHNSAKRWGPVHDTILFYGGGGKTTWNRVLQPLDEKYVERFYRHQDANGRYRISDLTGSGTRSGESGRDWAGVDPTSIGRHWAVPAKRSLPEWFSCPTGYDAMTVQERLDVLDRQGLVHWPDREGMPGFKRYLTAKSGAAIQDMVLDIRPLSKGQQESVGYPTQKPVALLERIIKASSNEGDVVLDPFCGCATACVAAERHHRQWLGIDISERAAELVQVRIRKEINLLHNFRPIHRTDQPYRTDLGKLPPPSAHKDLIYGKQSGQCGGCMVMFPKRNLTIDHIYPKSKGGTDHIENLWLLCGACNSSKGTKSQAEFLKERVKRGESIAWLQ